MMANPRSRATTLRVLTLTVLVAVPMLGGCVPQPPKPAPTPAPTATARPTPQPVPAAPSPDWRDRPETPGNWNWALSDSGSDAVFANGHFIMHCDPARQTITLLRSASSASGQVTMTIRTSETVRSLPAVPVAGGVGVTLSARDPLLDAMAFSRGRFAVEAAGTPPLYIPSWAEVSRVIEDCR
ncbi:hypothetical protein [Novosphingobium album (ex Hu et al. 2023)]|uniref:Lipoprotein n=1 Tax=Novosphingobium album (ex Hu et al. 2023) TaxID=2930093 RepID=A0ABT0B3E6_9SPHN|nr:hypothetical protein [Novosphingobium album (ex Hu et al. 2023)]MCJ2179554.1 hypothetical protein [Novosphingobium album (ex Hu et al. 2023)]